MKIIIDSEPPPARSRKQRLTDHHRSIKPGESFIADPATAHAFATFARYNEWQVRRKKIGPEQIQLWRVA